MTIDVRRSEQMEIGRHPCDEMAREMEAFYRKRPDIRFEVTLSLELTRPRAATLIYIRTLHKGRRHSSVVMDELCRCADRHDITIDLHASSIKEHGPRMPGLGQRALEAFYERRGFQSHGRRGGSATMRRLAPSMLRKSAQPKSQMGSRNEK